MANYKKKNRYGGFSNRNWWKCTKREEKNVVYESDSNTLSLLSTIKFQYCTFIYMGKSNFAI